MPRGQQNSARKRICHGCHHHGPAPKLSVSDDRRAKRVPAEDGVSPPFVKKLFAPRHEPLMLVGEGTSSQVWLVRDFKQHSQVAAKLMHYSARLKALFGIFCVWEVPDCVVCLDTTAAPEILGKIFYMMSNHFQKHILQRRAPIISSNN